MLSAAQLSGGRHQRLAIVQALARKPRILLLHELWRETSMISFVITPDIGEAFKLCARRLAFACEADDGVERPTIAGARPLSPA